MSDYLGIKEIQVSENFREVNRLLKNGWELLEIFKNEDDIMFVLGRRFYSSIEELRSDYGSEGTD